MNRTTAEPREKDKILSPNSENSDDVNVEYKAVGRMRATAVMTISEDKASATAMLNVGSRLP